MRGKSSIGAINRRIIIALSLLALAVGVVFLFLYLRARPRPLTDRVVSVRVEQVPFKDPDSSLWKKAPLARIELLPQRAVLPALANPTVRAIDVRSLNDGKWIAFLIEWEDKTRDAVVDVDKFTDQAAIQFPVDPHNLPSFTMGNKGGRVHIIHWKALWQDDIEKGYRDVQTLHPNYWVDMYFFATMPIYAEGEFPREPHVTHFRTPEAINYMPGAYARNPISIFDRQEPVEETMAEGFGTLTTQPRQNARGWGDWKNGRWRVIIARPIVSDDPYDAPLPEENSIAFAIWDGSAGNVGARKHYAPWVKLVVRRYEK